MQPTLGATIHALLRSASSLALVLVVASSFAAKGDEPATDSTQPSAPLSDDEILDQAYEQAQLIGKAMIDGDFEWLMEKCHPIVTALMGGKEGAIEVFTENRKANLEMGVRTTAFVPQRAGEVLPGGEGYLVITPYEMTVESDDQISVTSSYLLQTRLDTGDLWAYVDAAVMPSEEKIRWLFHFMPEDLELPETKNELRSK